MQALLRLGLEATPRLPGALVCQASFTLRHLLPSTSWLAPWSCGRPPSTKMGLCLAILIQEQVPGVLQGPCLPRWVLCLC